MDKYSKLAKNTGIFFVANFGSKLLTFLLVRFYTEQLSTQEYGILDVLNTTVSLAFPVVTLCVTEAVLRFSIDDKTNRGKILTNGLLVTVLGNLLFVLTAPALKHIDVFRENVWFLYALTLTNSLYMVTAHFARGIGKSTLFAMSGLLHTGLQVGLNILFLAAFHWGIKGYLLASILANGVTGITVFLVGRLYAYIKWNIDRKYLKQMLVYAIPLIPNSVFWWIMQSSDRYVITYLLSSADNGLYAVANKIPTLITTISGIFFQAWQISSVEEVNSEQKSQFYSSVFQMLSTVLIVASSALLVILRPLHWLLTEEAYHIGWTSTPYLMCAMVFSCYSSFLGTNYVAMKKTTGVFLTTVIGAVLNVILNFSLTPILGIRGTALATLIAFLITWVSRIFGTRKFVTITYSAKTFWIPVCLLLIQASLLTFGVDFIVIQLGFFTVIFALYFKNIVEIVRSFLVKFRIIKG